ncbi:[FeFe] hydrogenase H-cluster radical SAM maturase HydE [Shewanella sp. GXUN23E]|uniref:[FeFe] hydrogenase H-cluster radical SAM maturase HydE n=1 Tax=Shewanella sp. GXUN23E TaxID=3422498 RepID=UPI003D7DDAB1
MPIGAYVFTHEQLLELLAGSDDDWLFTEAANIATGQFSSEVYLRGIVEFSNYCRNNCHYCGLRAANRQVERYRLTPEQILKAVDLIAAMGMGTVVLQSGDDFTYRADTIAAIIREIKSRHDMAITLSLGDRQLDELTLWREAGADRYLLKMETFDRTLFAACRPDADFDERMARLKHLQQLGYQTGSGVITDLPGMTDDILARDLLTLTSMELDMLACGPFVAHAQTPFADRPNGDVQRSHRVSALLRLMNPDANIPATSSLDALRPGARIEALGRGCNVVMPSFTPQEVYASYNIYPGKNAAAGGIQDRLATLSQQLFHQGLVPSQARGDARRNPYVSRN